VFLGFVIGTPQPKTRGSLEKMAFSGTVLRPPFPTLLLTSSVHGSEEVFCGVLRRATDPNRRRPLGFPEPLAQTVVTKAAQLTPQAQLSGEVEYERKSRESQNKPNPKLIPHDD
jgi:hypothetical protein